MLTKGQEEVPMMITGLRPTRTADLSSDGVVKIPGSFARAKLRVGGSRRSSYEHTTVPSERHVPEDNTTLNGPEPKNCSLTIAPKLTAESQVTENTGRRIKAYQIAAQNQQKVWLRILE